MESVEFNMKLESALGQTAEETLRQQNEVLLAACQALEAERQRYLDLFKFAPDGYIVTVENGVIAEANLAASKLLNVKERLLIGKTLLVFVAKEEQQLFQEKLNQLEASPSAQVLEITLQPRRGQPVTAWATVNAVQDPDGKTSGLRWLLHTDPERKRAEAGLAQSREQLRALSQYLQSAREEERTRIAREIHDEFGQALTALKMDLAWVEKQLLPEQAGLHRKIRDMSGLVDSTIQTVRRVATELRPGLLDNLGLVSALEWQAGEFQTHTGIKCELRLPVEVSGLGRDQLTALFRAFQEALTNVARHAEATRVRVGLRERIDGIELVIRDNGKGIQENQILDPKSLGLIGIRERIQSFGGKIEIKGVPQKGTTFRVFMPKEMNGKKEPG